MDITITVVVPQLAELTQAVQEGSALLAQVFAGGGATPAGTDAAGDAPEPAGNFDIDY